MGLELVKKKPQLRDFVRSRAHDLSLTLSTRPRSKSFLLFLLNSIPRSLRKYVIDVDSLSSKMCSLFEIRLSYGTFYCTDIDCIKIVSPLFELEVLNEVVKVPRGGVFIDVGAHVGKYTVIASKLVGSSGRVIAIEPHPLNYLLLLRNIYVNRCRNVYALRICAWNLDGEVKLYISRKRSGTHSTKRNYNHSGDYIVVRAMRVDSVIKSLNIKRADLMKIDVEGAEYEVLEGAEDTLDTYRPDLVIEVFNMNKERVFEFLRKHRYRYRCLMRGDPHYIKAYSAM